MIKFTIVKKTAKQMPFLLQSLPNRGHYRNMITAWSGDGDTAPVLLIGRILERDGEIWSRRGRRLRVGKPIASSIWRRR